MLMRFTVENVLCFKDEAVFSLIASNDDKHIDHIYNAADYKRPRILRVSAIYGANGHGKTRLVDAISFMREFVVHGTESGDRISIPCFKLDNMCSSRRSKFVVEFRIGDFDYEYAIQFDPMRIYEEWLYRLGSNGKESLLFERVNVFEDDGSYENKTKFGKILRDIQSPSKEFKAIDFLKFISIGTRANQPFLTEAADKNVHEMALIYDWFKSVLTPISADSAYRFLFKRFREEERFMKNVSKFISKADVGIDRIELKDAGFDSETISLLPPDIVESVQEGLDLDNTVEVGNRDGSLFYFSKNKDNEIIGSRITSIRKNNLGNEVTFGMEEESSGTRRLLDIVPMALEDKKRVYIVDELDRKLHPILARRFIEIFIKSNSNQMVYTTHNTYLLDLDLLRRDEIWFVQKKENGSSDLYSLSDLKVRPDLDVRKGYLNGRFGAIPFDGNLTDLGWV